MCVGGGGIWTPPGKSQVAIGFLRNTGTDPPRARGVHMALCEKISGSAHAAQLQVGRIFKRQMLYICVYMDNGKLQLRVIHRSR